MHKQTFYVCIYNAEMKEKKCPKPQSFSGSTSSAGRALASDGE